MWEKAGVNVSVVYGSMPPEAYRAATGTTKNLGKENGAQDRVPFFACGISSVMHPHNPFAPTMHFNYRQASALAVSFSCIWLQPLTHIIPDCFNIGFPDLTMSCEVTTL